MTTVLSLCNLEPTLLKLMGRSSSESSMTALLLATLRRGALVLATAVAVVVAVAVAVALVAL